MEQRQVLPFQKIQFPFQTTILDNNSESIYRIIFHAGLTQVKFSRATDKSV